MSKNPTKDEKGLGTQLTVVGEEHCDGRISEREILKVSEHRSDELVGVRSRGVICTTVLLLQRSRPDTPQTLDERGGAPTAAQAAVLGGRRCLPDRQRVGYRRHRLLALSAPPRRLLLVRFFSSFNSNPRT